MTDERSDYLSRINASIGLLLWHGHRHFVVSMENLGLTVPQAAVLFCLESSGSELSMSELARMAQQTPATLTGIVDRLIAAGLLERARDTNDRRVVLVRLTEAGLAKAAEITSSREFNMGRLTQSFSREELAQLDSMLERLAVAIIADIEFIQSQRDQGDS